MMTTDRQLTNALRGPSPIVRLPNGDAILAGSITGAFAADADDSMAGLMLAGLPVVPPGPRVIVAHGDHREVLPCETFEDACAARDAIIEQWETGLRCGHTKPASSNLRASRRQKVF